MKIDHTSFDRKYARLTTEEYPQFHQTLIDLHRDDISWRIDRCGIDGVRLDCEDNGQHYKYFPVPCQRRICPQCAQVALGKFYWKYSKLQTLFNTHQNHPEEFPPGFSFRFWTFTIRSKPHTDLFPKFLTCRRSIDRWWRYTHGERSKYNSSHSGGIFVFEVQAGWNVHIHAIIFGPYLPVKFTRDQWTESVHFYGDYSNRIHVKKIEEYSAKSILELLCYPLHPDKNGSFSQLLLANIEVAMSRGIKHENQSTKPPVRRIFEKGSFYQLFTMQKQIALCPDCAEHHHVAAMNHEPIYDYIWGRRFQKNLFTINKEGLNNYDTIAYKFPDLQLLIPNVDTIL